MYMVKFFFQSFQVSFQYTTPLLVAEYFLVLKMLCYFHPRSQFTILTSALLLVASSQNLRMIFLSLLSLSSASWLLQTSRSLRDPQVCPCLVHCRPSTDPAFILPPRSLQSDCPPYLPSSHISSFQGSLKSSRSLQRVLLPFDQVLIPQILKKFLLDCLVRFGNLGKPFSVFKYQQYMHNIKHTWHSGKESA